MNKKLIFLLLTCWAVISQAQLSENAFASLLTCGPGDEFYTNFGHSAIRVCDTSAGLDVVYNYGTFDFNQPHFYWTFACGRLNYRLSRDSFDGFLFDYGYEGRSVWEQRLRLSHQEVCNLFVLLENNYLPEYRYYMYDFFRDNCATRPRDIIDNALCHREHFSTHDLTEKVTYRDKLYEATEERLLWWRFGIDLVLGMRCDHRCNNMELMFSPIELMAQMDTVLVSDTQESLAEEAVQLLEETRSPLAKSLSPTLCFWFLFTVVLCLTVIGWSKGWRLRWIDVTLYVATLLVMILIAFLWFFSSHYCTKANLNILWASPLFLYFLIRWEKSNHWIILAQLIMLTGVVVMTLLKFPQRFNVAIVPICFTLMLRLITLLRRQAMSKFHDKIETK